MVISLCGKHFASIGSAGGVRRIVRHECNREIDTGQLISLHQQRRNRLTKDVRADSSRAARFTTVAAKSRSGIAAQGPAAAAKGRLTRVRVERSTSNGGFRPRRAAHLLHT